VTDNKLDGKRDQQDMEQTVPEPEAEQESGEATVQEAAAEAQAETEAEAETEAVAEAEAETEAEAESETDPANLRALLEEARAEAAEYLDGWQRARAELANFRKRTERDRSQWQIMLRGEAINSLLPVLDDFDLAMENLPDDLKDHDWVAGIVLIHRKFQTTLQEQGVQEIPAAGEPFDPEVHEAVMRRADPEAEPGTVIEVLRKGYKLEDRVIRPALVVVAE